VEATGAVVRYLPDRRALAVARAGAAGGWCLMGASYLAVAASTSSDGYPGWLGPAGLAVLGISAFPALRLTGRARQLARLDARAPRRLAERRFHGELPAAATAGSRSLRTVGADSDEIVARTDARLSALTVMPGVRIFRGVRGGNPARVVAMHAVSAGPVVVLVESVAWPPGHYQLDGTGRVRCDGVPTGQTVEELVASVAECRRLLPRDHQVSALVSVHRTGSDGYVLPLPERAVSWTFDDDLVATLTARLAWHSASVSRHVVAALSGRW
jgi:hypothetical protein